MNYVKIQITRPTNRRCEPIDSDYEVLMTFETDHKELLNMTGEEIAEELFVATNAPTEIHTPLQEYLNNEYKIGLCSCKNHDINFFSMSVGDKVAVKHVICPVFDYTLEEWYCDSIGWTKTYGTKAI
jgi:hypothetical protein